MDRMNAEFDPTRPIYLQIMEAVKKGAAQGRYPCGEKLPSVRDMAREMRVNPNTMSRAYMELEREGFITTRRGEGSFITEDPGRVTAEKHALARSARDRFVAEIQSLALNPAQVDLLLRSIEEETGPS